MSGDEPRDVSMLDLFREEAEAQSQVLTSGLLALERDHGDPDQLEACMRSAHSLKGAARIVGLSAGVRLAHAMEDCFVAAQRKGITLQHPQIDLLLGAVDLLTRIAATPEADLAEWTDLRHSEVDACLVSLGRILDPGSAAVVESSLDESPAKRGSGRPTTAAADARDASDRVLRVTAESLNRLLGLASESLVESRWVKPFAESLRRLKRQHEASGRMLDDLRETLSAAALDQQAQVELAAAQRGLLECQQTLAQHLADLEMFDRRSSNLSHRLYDEALACRMRPFADGVQRFPRTIRDLARSLGKEARLEIVGETTQVDRDILARLDAALGHLLHNAVDHGLEMPHERLAAGKPAEGVVRLEARHSAGILQLIVSDDGHGVDLHRLRAAVVDRKLAAPEAADAMSDAELLEFLFLPGFTMKGTITELSGRGVGLDAVQNMVKQVRGTVRVSSQPGKGTSFQLQLPITLSVVRTLLADIGSEPYAFPLASIVRALKIPRDRVSTIEGRQHFDLEGRSIGLITAHQVLGVAPAHFGDELCVIVVGTSSAHAYGLIVDRFLGERELVVQPLDTQLGKIKDIAAGALMEDGSPVLIVDTDDLIRSVDKLVAGTRVATAQAGSDDVARKRRKRVLVVDDSLTVRELERKVLSNRGYDVEVAVDGMDGWNAVRTSAFHLVLTDIDMPRMDGIELVTLINKHPTLKSMPVMIVSYKDRDEDRRRGLEAGAAHYLTKGSFHDETLVQAVIDLIGEAEA
jgi:two-component system sensor histidine kinase and response regulator WspE